MQTRRVLEILSKGSEVNDIGDGPLSKLAQKYLDDFANTDREITARREGNGVNIPFADALRKKVAKVSESENESIPVIAKFDLYREISASAKRAPKDTGMQRLAMHTKKIWESDPLGMATHGEVYGLIRFYKETNAGSKAASAVEAACSKMGAHKLPVAKLARIAANISSQSDYDSLIVSNRLNGNRIEDIRSRSFIRQLVAMKNVALSTEKQAQVTKDFKPSEDLDLSTSIPMDQPSDVPVEDPLSDIDNVMSETPAEPVTPENAPEKVEEIKDVVEPIQQEFREDLADEDAAVPYAEHEQQEGHTDSVGTATWGAEEMTMDGEGPEGKGHSAPPMSDEWMQEEIEEINNANEYITSGGLDEDFESGALDLGGMNPDELMPEVDDKMASGGGKFSERVSKAPPGMEDVVLKLKKEPSVKNPFATAWAMYNKKHGKTAQEYPHNDNTGFEQPNQPPKHTLPPRSIDKKDPKEQSRNLTLNPQLIKNQRDYATTKPVEQKPKSQITGPTLSRYKKPEEKDLSHTMLPNALTTKGACGPMPTPETVKSQPENQTDGRVEEFKKAVEAKLLADESVQIDNTKLSITADMKVHLTHNGDVRECDLADMSVAIADFCAMSHQAAIDKTASMINGTFNVVGLITVPCIRCAAVNLYDQNTQDDYECNCGEKVAAATIKELDEALPLKRVASIELQYVASKNITNQKARTYDVLDAAGARLIRDAGLKVSYEVEGDPSKATDALRGLGFRTAGEEKEAGFWDRIKNVFGPKKDEIGSLEEKLKADQAKLEQLRKKRDTKDPKQVGGVGGRVPTKPSSKMPPVGKAQGLVNPTVDKGYDEFAAPQSTQSIKDQPLEDLSSEAVMEPTQEESASIPVPKVSPTGQKQEGRPPSVSSQVSHVTQRAQDTAAAAAASGLKLPGTAPSASKPKSKESLESERSESSKKFRELQKQVGKEKGESKPPPSPKGAAVTAQVKDLKDPNPAETDNLSHIITTAFTHYANSGMDMLSALDQFKKDYDKQFDMKDANVRNQIGKVGLQAFNDAKNGTVDVDAAGSLSDVEAPSPEPLSDTSLDSAPDLNDSPTGIGVMAYVTMKEAQEKMKIPKVHKPSDIVKVKDVPGKDSEGKDLLPSPGKINVQQKPKGGPSDKSLGKDSEGKDLLPNPGKIKVEHKPTDQSGTSLPEPGLDPDHSQDDPFKVPALGSTPSVRK